MFQVTWNPIISYVNWRNTPTGEEIGEEVDHCLSSAAGRLEFAYGLYGWIESLDQATLIPSSLPAKYREIRTEDSAPKLDRFLFDFCSALYVAHQQLHEAPNIDTDQQPRELSPEARASVFYRALKPVAKRFAESLEVLNHKTSGRIVGYRISSASFSRLIRNLAGQSQKWKVPKRLSKAIDKTGGRDSGTRFVTFNISEISNLVDTTEVSDTMTKGKNQPP